MRKFLKIFGITFCIVMLGFVHPDLFMHPDGSKILLFKEDDIIYNIRIYFNYLLDICIKAGPWILVEAIFLSIFFFILDKYFTFIRRQKNNKIKSILIIITISICVMVLYILLMRILDVYEVCKSVFHCLSMAFFIIGMNVTYILIHILSYIFYILFSENKWIGFIIIATVLVLPFRNKILSIIKKKNKDTYKNE